MKNALIVAETNPLHYGHVYLMDQPKKSGYRIIILMSASFTQRGLPVVTDPFTRANDLVKNGGDVVLTLPTQIATSYGEMFSHGAMTIAERFGTIDAVFCGTEWGDKDLYEQIYDYEEKPIFSKHLKESLDRGKSFSESYLTALEKENTQWKGLFQSNALLAYGYFKALKKINSSIEFYPVTRLKTSNHPLVSASYIRKHYDESAEELKKACAGTPPEFSEGRLLESLYPLYRSLILNDSHDWSLYNGYEKGIDDRILRSLGEYDFFEDFLENTKTRRYSRWRISRLLFHRFLNMTSEDIQESIKNQSAFYVLAFSEQGRSFLKDMKSTDVILFTNYKDVRKLSPQDQKFLSYEEKAMDLWSILTQSPTKRLFIGR